MNPRSDPAAGGGRSAWENAKPAISVRLGRHVAHVAASNRKFLHFPCDTVSFPSHLAKLRP